MAKYGQTEPFDCPIEMTVVAVMPVQKSATKRFIAQVQTTGVWHTYRPDTSNLCKLVEDAILGVAYTDDSLICAERAIKIYGEVPGVYIKISPINETVYDYMTRRGIEMKEE